MTDKKKRKKIYETEDQQRRKMCMQKNIFLKHAKQVPWKKKCDMVHLLCIAYIKENEPKKIIKKENL